MIIEAKINRLDDVLAFIDEGLEKAGAPFKTQTQMDIAVEEIFVNIASYAYPEGGGQAEIRFQMDEATRTVTITFLDSGIPFNPLAREDPDVTLSAEERGIGGLGIYMVKQSMDDVRYEYRDGKNILTIEKKI